MFKLFPGRLHQVKTFEAPAIDELDDAINNWAKETNSLILLMNPVAETESKQQRTSVIYLPANQQDVNDGQITAVDSRTETEPTVELANQETRFGPGIDTDPSGGAGDDKPAGTTKRPDLPTSL